MAVVNIREVGMRVRERLVHMRVRMRLLPVPREIMLVLMMLVMAVRMGM